MHKIKSESLSTVFLPSITDLIMSLSTSQACRIFVARLTAVVWALFFFFFCISSCLLFFLFFSDSIASTLENLFFFLTEKVCFALQSQAW